MSFTVYVPVHEDVISTDATGPLRQGPRPNILLVCKDYLLCKIHDDLPAKRMDKTNSSYSMSSCCLLPLTCQSMTARGTAVLYSKKKITEENALY